MTQKPMDLGRLRLGIAALGSYARAQHSGRAGDGFAGTTHRIDIGWVEWNFDAQLALDPRFAIDVMLPLRLTTLAVSSEGPGGRRLRDEDTIHRDQTVFGLGDMLLAGRFGIVRNDDVRGWNLDARIGATLPSGKVQPNPFHPASMGVQKVSLGSGTIDPVVGIDSTYNAGKWGLTTWASARVPVVDNRFGTRSSRVVQAGAGPFTGFGLVRWRFLLQPEVFYASPVRWLGRDAPSSDRLSLLATVGAVVQPRPRFNVNMMVKVPYYTRAETGRFTWPIVAMIGLNYTFELIPEKEHKH